ncbi:MAG: glutaredoxin 3 [Magnetococcales bacterium]|nr:glutaredoxin 3 [Magnetococcales bacterium]
MPQITIYSTTVCPYCVRAKALLQKKGVAYEEINLDVSPERREEMLGRANGRRTVPQIFIGDRHIGGCDDLHALDAKGELDPLLAGK